MPDRYFVSGGVDNNWGSTANWSATSGGAGGVSIPTSADAVFFDANSPNVTVNASTRSCLSLNFTGYSNTITMSQQIQTGSCTLSPSMGVAGSGTLTINSTATLTSNGRAWPNTLSLNSSSITLFDNWTNNGPVTFVGPTVVLNGNSLIFNGGMTQNLGVSGTTKLVFSGGVFSGSTAALVSNVDFNGDITFPNAGTLTLGGGTYSYVSGTVTFAGSHTLRIIDTSTLNLQGITWQAIVVAPGALRTITLTSKLVAAGLVALGTGSTSLVINGSVIETSGGLRFSYTSATVSGTTQFVIKNTCTIDSPSVTTGFTFNPIIIDAPSGDITIADPGVRTILGKFIVRNAGSITTTEAWDLGGGGGVFDPLNYPLIN